jgi:RNA ligase
MATIDITAFREREAAGLITARTHPTHDLIIWNYTAQCIWDRAWDEVTIQARGLITTPDGEIVARPFRKFFNYGEPGWEDFPNEPFTVTSKEDGSLGILYFVDSVSHIATRGSFTSEQAQKATAMLRDKYADFAFERHYTYLFEIVYPANRVVLDYGDREDLILIAVIHTETGEEVDIHNPIWVKGWPFPLVQRYDGIADVDELLAMDGANKEGFVLRFESGLRLKVKYEEYKRIHAIITRTSSRTVWQHLKEDRSLAELLDRVPDEFTEWVRAQSRELGNTYGRLYRRTQEAYKEVIAQARIVPPVPLGQDITYHEVEKLSRAMKAHVKTEIHRRYPDLEYFILILYGDNANDKKRVLHDAIWDSLYPAYSRPFMERSEDVA